MSNFIKRKISRNKNVVLVTGTNKKKFLLNLNASNIYCIYPIIDETGEYSKVVKIDGTTLILNETIAEIYYQMLGE